MSKAYLTSLVHVKGALHRGSRVGRRHPGHARIRPALLGAGILVVSSACGSTTTGSAPSATGISTLRAHYIPLPTRHASPTGITLGPDGALWITEETGSRIARITTTGAVTEFDLPHGSAPGLGITPGPDGALWFTDRGADAVGRITTGGAVARFPLQKGSMPLGICFGPLQSMWLTQTGSGEVDRVGTDGAATAVAHLGSDAAPAGIVSGADGNLWIATKSAIVRMTPQGAVTSFALPDQVGGALRIVRGIGGDLWFVEEQGGHVGHITPAGKITLLPQILDAPTGIVEGPDGHMWIAEQGDGRIDRLDGNQFTPFAVGAYSNGPEDIVAGPGHTLWFTEFVAGMSGGFRSPRGAGSRSVDLVRRGPSRSH